MLRWSWKPPALKSLRLPASAARSANTRPSATTPCWARRSPIWRAVAPLGTVRRTVPCALPWKGWNAATISAIAAPATRSASSAKTRRPQWRRRWRGSGPREGGGGVPPRRRAGGSGGWRAAVRAGSGGSSRPSAWTGSSSRRANSPRRRGPARVPLRALGPPLVGRLPARRPGGCGRPGGGLGLRLGLFDRRPVGLGLLDGLGLRLGGRRDDLEARDRRLDIGRRDAVVVDAVRGAFVIGRDARRRRLGQAAAARKAHGASVRALLRRALRRFVLSAEESHAVSAWPAAVRSRERGG